MDGLDGSLCGATIRATLCDAKKLTNSYKADLGLCLAQFLDAQVFLGDTAVGGALVAPGKENLNHSKDS